MIHNALCPYCSVRMVKAENQDNSRSVEHLIPNTVLRCKRKNDEGDFYACRKCNARKSSIDYVLGVVTKSQSRDDDFAAQTLVRAVAREDRSSARFVDMVASATTHADEVHMEIPISGPELLEYMQFLGKGQYFKKSHSIFQPRVQVMLVGFANKEVHAAFEASYHLEHGTNPFRDLESNRYSEVFSEGDCIIWSKNSNFLFIFHDYTSVSIWIKRRNRKNTVREQGTNAQVLADFATGRGSHAKASNPSIDRTAANCY